jgi:hypothetical protein
MEINSETYQVFWIGHLNVLVHFKLVVNNSLRILHEIVIIVELLLVMIRRVRLDLVHRLLQLLRLLARILNI